MERVKRPWEIGFKIVVILLVIVLFIIELVRIGTLELPFGAFEVFEIVVKVIVIILLIVIVRFEWR